MRGEILEILGVTPHWETDHNETDMSNLIGGVSYRFLHPDGTEEVLSTGVRPGENNVFNKDLVSELQKWKDAGGIIPAYIETVTNQQINEERKRRKELGIIYNGIYLRGDPDDRENLSNLYNIAQVRLTQGDNTTVTNYMDGNNVVHQLTPQEIVDCYLAGLQYISEIYSASWSIKAMNRENLDHTSDSLWPNNGIS